MSKKSMEEKLAEFEKRTKPITPTSVLMDEETVEEPKKEKENLGNREDLTTSEETKSNGIADLVKVKKKMEETHTRRTFLVENELLNRLDEIAEKTQNRSFKTDFINYVIKQGLDELDQI